MALATDISPFTGKGAPRRGKDVTWVKAKLIAEIEFAGWTGDGMVRQAAFKGLREDKPAREVRAEEAVPPDEIESTAPEKLKAKTAHRAKAEGNVVLATVISNPDKLLWPKEGKSEGYSKIDLARYLEEVGPWMIEHLRGRPCSMIRTPDGINSASNSFSVTACRACRTSSTSSPSRRNESPMFRSIAWRHSSLRPRSPLSSTIHGTTSLAIRENPAALVFDLDPAPDVDFNTVIEAAKELKARLERLGLTTFCKTTGGKGLHVVTPLTVKIGRGPRMARGEDFRASGMRAHGSRQPGTIPHRHD